MSATTTPGRARPRTTARAAASARAGVGLVLPALVLMVVLAIIPIVTVVGRAIGGGWQPFADLLANASFGKVMLNTLLWTVSAVVGALVVGTAAALLLQSRHLRLVGVWRSLLMVPWIVPGVVAATVWRWSLSSDYSVLNDWLVRSGLTSEPIRWLSDTRVVLAAVTLVQIWVTAPFVMLMVSAALSGIPQERYEAARLDGCAGRQVFRFVVVPEIATTMGIAALTLVVWALNSFTIIFVMTGGGPVSASTILPILLYQAFNRGDEATVYAVAIIQLVICAVAAVAYVRSVRGDLEGD